MVSTGFVSSGAILRMRFTGLKKCGFIVHRESTGLEIPATILLRNLRLVAYMWFAGLESCVIINLGESMGLEDMALYFTENPQDLRF